MVIWFLFSAIMLFVLFNCLSSLIDGEIVECESFVLFLFILPLSLQLPGMIPYVAQCRYKIDVTVMNKWNLFSIWGMLWKHIYGVYPEVFEWPKILWMDVHI